MWGGNKERLWMGQFAPFTHPLDSDNNGQRMVVVWGRKKRGKKKSALLSLPWRTKGMGEWAKARLLSRRLFTTALVRPFLRFKVVWKRLKVISSPLSLVPHLFAPPCIWADFFSPTAVCLLPTVYPSLRPFACLPDHLPSCLFVCPFLSVRLTFLSCSKATWVTSTAFFSLPFWQVKRAGKQPLRSGI